MPAVAPAQQTKVSGTGSSKTQHADAPAPPLETAGRVLCWVLAAVALLGCAIRVAQISNRPVWDDEAWSYFISSQGLSHLFRGLPLDNHPPLLYLLQMLFLRMGLPAEIAIRLPSLLGGILLVPAAGWVAARHWGQEAGWWAAALVAVAPVLVYISIEARFYSLLGLLTIVSAQLWWDYLERPSARGAALAGLVTLIASYTMYFGTFALVFAGVLFLRRRQSWRVATAFPIVLTGVLILPLLPLILAQRASYAHYTFVGAGYGEQLGLARTLFRSLLVLGNGGYPDDRIRLLGHGVFLLAAVAALALSLREREQRGRLVFPVLLGLTLVALWQAGGSLHLWPVRDNYLAVIIVPFIVAISGACCSARPQLLGRVSLGAVLAVMLTGTAALAQGRGRINPDYRTAAEITARMKPGGLLFARTWGDLSCFEFYDRDQVPLAVYGIDPGSAETFEAQVVDRPLHTTDDLIEKGSRLALVGKLNAGAFSVLEQRLRQAGYTQSDRQEAHQVGVELWTRAQRPAIPNQSRPTHAAPPISAPN